MRSKATILLVTVAVLLSAAVFVATYARKNVTKEVPHADFDVIVASDVHFLSPNINDNGDMFHRLMSGRDAKTTEYCEELTDSFLNEVIEKKPEALIITGDLAFNGALESHKDLAARLKKVKEAGIAVLVLPGNHDVYCSNAAAFQGDSYTLVQSATSESFKEIYADFGYSEALSVDEMSASYMYELNENTRVLMLDANTAEHPCEIAPSTLKWMKKQLKKANAAGKYVICGIHQNILVHNEMFVSGYVISNADKVAEALRKAGVKLVLSGHMHNQNYVTEDNLTDLASSALSVYPCQYGILKGENGKIDYHTNEVSVDVGFDFKAYAAKCMDKMSNPQRETFIENGLDEDLMEKFLKVFGDVNRSYFSGDMTEFDQLLNSDDMKEYLRTEESHNKYIDIIARESGKDLRRFTIDE